MNPRDSRPPVRHRHNALESDRRVRHNEGVIDLTEPQVWVLIGVFAAAIFGMLSWQTISFNRTVDMAMKRTDARIDAMDAKLDARIETLDARFDARIEALDAKLSGKIDSLDRDVQALTRHAWPNN